VDQGIIALKFGATWCGPCKTMAPIFDKVSGEFPTVDCRSVDVDEEPGMAKKFSVRSVPTVILLKDGREVQRIVGLARLEPLRRAFRET